LILRPNGVLVFPFLFKSIFSLRAFFPFFYAYFLFPHQSCLLRTFSSKKSRIRHSRFCRLFLPFCRTDRDPPFFIHSSFQPSIVTSDCLLTTGDFVFFFLHSAKSCRPPPLILLANLYAPRFVFSDCDASHIRSHLLQNGSSSSILAPTPPFAPLSKFFIFP